ncbi:hypothetical protein F5Y16DRAFT_143722 [Xylariaceae sp. FL0255]|nr:hypothetical protein F5Y16DRAFT_143722 [Xylariaceae sp. FL0255]
MTPLSYFEGFPYVMVDPAYFVKLEQESEARAGWQLPPIGSAIGVALFTKQSKNRLLDIIYRAHSVYETLRNLWNDFCLWSKERREPGGVWSCQIGYEDPSRNPKWRMKSTIEIRTWENMNTVFNANTMHAKWRWKSSRVANRRFFRWREGSKDKKRPVHKVSKVKVPLW